MNRTLSSVLDFVVIPAATTAAVVAIGTLMPSPAKAERVLIEIDRLTWEPDPPGSVAEKGRIYGFASYIDVQSIIRRGDFAYYNTVSFCLNEGGMRFPVCPVEGQPGFSPHGHEANCRTQMVKAADGWKAWGNNWFGAAARIACR